MCVCVCVCVCVYIAVQPKNINDASAIDMTILFGAPLKKASLSIMCIHSDIGNLKLMRKKDAITIIFH